MADFLDILKRLFVQEVEVSEESEDQSESTDQDGVSDSDEQEMDKKNEKPRLEESDEIPAELMDKFRNIFQQALDDHNKEGFDYLEFRHSLKSMQNITDDEATCFQSIYATAKTLGASRESLVQSIEHYKDVLKEEEQKFSQALKKQKKRRMETLDQRLEEIQQDIRDKREQIHSLKQKIEEEREEAKNIQQMIARSDQKISQTRQAFSETYDHFIEQMENDKQKMKKYLTNGD